MRKRTLLLLALALLLLPAAGTAQELPDLLSAVYDGIGEGLKEGTVAALAGMDQELTLEIEPESARIEEGKTLRLTVTAGNPRPVETAVTISLRLPQRLAVTPDAAWEAVLPAATADPQTGALVPSVTSFTRELLLTAGGESEQTDIECEMSLGTRFYRARTALDLCVPDISASAAAEGLKDGRLYPGDAFAYQVEIANGGTAPKDVPVELILPDGVELTQALPLGFTRTGSVIRGQVRAEAAVAGETGLTASAAVIRLNARVAEDALAGDADAMRLMSGVLRVDGKRVALPRIQLCGSRISAQLVAASDALEEGEETDLRIVVVNSGLAPADVRVSCVLPQGLMLAQGESEKQETATQSELTREATLSELPVYPAKDGGAGSGAAILTAGAAGVAAVSQENRTLIFDLHMDAAKETDGGVDANTQVLAFRVKAAQPQEKLSERLVGTTLAWSVDDGEAQLGEAVAMRVYRPEFMGLSRDEWSGVFWASVLLMVTVVCLYAAVRSDSRREDCCCD